MTIQLKPIVTEVMQLLRTKMRAEARAQGHRLTGRLEESIDFEIEEKDWEAVGRMFAEDYSTFVEFGVKASRIPYSSGGGGRGGTSLYIQGLISFWEHKGLSGREAIGAAFATAKVHAREGMPSRASYSFSSTGERTGFIKTAIDESMAEITKLIEERYGIAFELNFGQSLGTYDNIKIL